MTTEIQPTSKQRLESAIQEWVADAHASTSHVIVEYVVVAKTYDMSEPESHAHYVYGWRQHPDPDVLVSILRRAIRKVWRTQK